jgi:hypothetical protein
MTEQLTKLTQIERQEAVPLSEWQQLYIAAVQRAESERDAANADHAVTRAQRDVLQGALDAEMAHKRDILTALDEALAEAARGRSALFAANARIAELESPPCGCAAAGHIVTVCDAHRALAAANARVAELERQNSRLITELHEAGARVDSANDRADAAERAHAQQAEMHQVACNMNLARTGKAESERDEWKAKCEAAEQRLVGWERVALSHDPTKEAAKLIAESEAASLRVEITQANLDKAAAIGELNMALHASEHWSKEAAYHRDESAQWKAKCEALCETAEHLAAATELVADIRAFQRATFGIANAPAAKETDQ